MIHNNDGADDVDDADDAASQVPNGGGNDRVITVLTSRPTWMAQVAHTQIVIVMTMIVITISETMVVLSCYDDDGCHVMMTMTLMTMIAAMIC